MKARQKLESAFFSYKALQKNFDNEFKKIFNIIYVKAKSNRRQQREGKDT